MIPPMIPPTSAASSSSASSSAPPDGTPACRVRDLFVYPLKSAAGIRLDRAPLDACGIVDDRRWMLIDADGQFLTQRELPRLALVRAVPHADGLVLDAPALPIARLAIERPGPAATRRAAAIWEDECEVVDCGDAAASWLEELLEVACRLVYRPADADRLVDQTYGQPHDRVGLSDGFPLLLIGHASLDALNARLAAIGAPPVPMNRFRPNVVIEGAAPHAEDVWRRLAIHAADDETPMETAGGGDDGDDGDDRRLRLDVVKPCARCAIVPVDQTTGVRGLEPLRTLATYRRGPNGKVYFGQNVIHRGQGSIAVGDAVRIVE